jgi:hypothetical protein
LSKYGVVETHTLKTRIDNQEVISRGIAIVQFAEKDGAAKAMRELPFNTTLGKLLDVDFYQSKESRMQDLEKKNNPLK